MKIKAPQSIYLKGDRHQAILLLHSFTGTVRDVKHLATTLNSQGFTCYVPNYPGHGLPLDQFTQYDIDDWWNEVKDAYHFLENEGYQHISATGVSLGGLFTLRLAEQFDLERIAVMSAPHKKGESGIAKRIEKYGQRMNQILNFDDEEQLKQMNTIHDYNHQIELFQKVIEDIMTHLKDVKVPSKMMYGEQDDEAYALSAQFIYDHLGTSNKELNSFAQCGHLMTHGKGRDELEHEIVQFFRQ
ncbi:alpha/beta fold hydrolase [Staphylococcus caprae]|uniref:alpha/beta hydrolase n=1 Tax=Staphylococcus TaxID=1279 RepID=UPI0008A950AB|nr:alpha/beta fold hydrolase [Staphylococcus sp. HMSC62A08]OHS41694.1 carboxylesterase [Staphylococcus sp. HMSC62A08]